MDSHVIKSRILETDYTQVKHYLDDSLDSVVINLPFGLLTLDYGTYGCNYNNQRWI